MTLPDRSLPVVTVFAGHDPTGGAGIQADIESVTALGARATTLITALTVQDTRNVAGFTCVDPEMLRAQARLLLDDIAPDAFKTGMTGSAGIVRVIAGILRENPGIPVVVDPVLAAGGGTRLGDDDLYRALRDELFPLATLVTPNEPEARALAPEATTLNDCAQALLACGCQYVLITGGHSSDKNVVGRLFDRSGLLHEFICARLPGEFHGSGCTLASAIAARLAAGATMIAAIETAVAFTSNTLVNALSPGKGQAIPDRFSSPAAAPLPGNEI